MQTRDNQQSQFQNLPFLQNFNESQQQRIIQLANQLLEEDGYEEEEALQIAIEKIQDEHERSQSQQDLQMTQENTQSDQTVNEDSDFETTINNSETQESSENLDGYLIQDSFVNPQSESDIEIEKDIESYDLYVSRNPEGEGWIIRVGTLDTIEYQSNDKEETIRKAKGLANQRNVKVIIEED
jgi:uncharacterized protein YdaT